MKVKNDNQQPTASEAQLALLFDQSLSVDLCIQDYKSLFDLCHSG